MDFQKVCDETSDIAENTPADLRPWLYLVLRSPKVRVALFDETIPDHVSLERLSERPLAKILVTEYSARPDRPEEPDLLSVLVDILNSLNELKKSIDLVPDLAASVEGPLRASNLCLGELYGALAKFPGQMGSARPHQVG